MTIVLLLAVIFRLTEGQAVLQYPEICEWDLFQCDNGRYTFISTYKYHCNEYHSCPVNFRCCHHPCFRHRICQPRGDGVRKRMVFKDRGEKAGVCDVTISCEYLYPREFIKMFQCEHDHACPDGHKCCWIDCWNMKACQPLKLLPTTETTAFESNSTTQQTTSTGATTERSTQIATSATTSTPIPQVALKEATTVGMTSTTTPQTKLTEPTTLTTTVLQATGTTKTQATTITSTPETTTTSSITTTEATDATTLATTTYGTPAATEADTTTTLSTTPSAQATTMVTTSSTPTTTVTDTTTISSTSTTANTLSTKSIGQNSTSKESLASISAEKPSSDVEEPTITMGQRTDPVTVAQSLDDSSDLTTPISRYIPESGTESTFNDLLTTEPTTEVTVEESTNGESMEDSSETLLEIPTATEDSSTIYSTTINDTAFVGSVEETISVETTTENEDWPTISYTALPDESTTTGTAEESSITPVEIEESTTTDSLEDFAKILGEIPTEITNSSMISDSAAAGESTIIEDASSTLEGITTESEDLSTISDPKLEPTNVSNILPPQALHAERKDGKKGSGGGGRNFETDDEDLLPHTGSGSGFGSGAGRMSETTDDEDFLDGSGSGSGSGNGFERGDPDVL